MITHFIAMAALAATAASAGPYDQPYALVERGDGSEVRREATVGISKIDGVTNRDARRSDPLAPGKHEITVHFTTARGVFKPETKVLNLDLAPCTRYRVVASYQATRGPDWEPKVYQESIGECTKKFGIKGQSAK